MNNMNKIKKLLLTNVLSLLLCLSMLAGTTYAWFTDTETSAGNKIQAGTLDVDLELLDKKTGEWSSLKDSHAPIFNYDRWEPGYVDTKILKIENEGTLALKWYATVYSETELSILADVIDVYVCPSESELKYPADRDLTGYTLAGTLRKFITTLEDTTNGELDAKESAYLGIALKMREEAGNEYQGLSLGGAFDIRIFATQHTAEFDSFDNTYDKLADPSILATQSKTLASGENSIEFSLTHNNTAIASVSVPADAIADPSLPVTVMFDSITPSDASIIDENTKAYAYDISVTNLKGNLEGDQLITLVITAPSALAAMKTYHNGVLVSDAVYDEVAGTITLKTASFSPFDFTTQEYEVSTLAELREMMKIEGAYIKLAKDITVDLTKDTGKDRDVDHAYLSNGTPKYYNGVMVQQMNVALDLNGHSITAVCGDLYNSNSDVGALFFIGDKGSLNILDSVGTGFIKMRSSIYAVWAPYETPSYVDIYSGAFIADSYAGDPIGTPVDSNGNYDPVNGTMKNENSNRALIYAGVGGNMNVYGGYFLYNNTPNDTKDRNNGAFNAKDFYSEEAAAENGPLLTIHDGVYMINKEYRQNPANTSQPNGDYDNFSVVLDKHCEVVENVSHSVKIDGKTYNTWCRVTLMQPVSLTVEGLQESYAVGDTINGFTVKANYTGGVSKTLEADKYTVSDVDMSTIGAKFITITYTENDKTVEHTIQTKAVAITGIYAETKIAKFEIGKTVAKSNFKVYATSNDGSIVEITDFTLSGLNPNLAGTQSATITYSDFSTTCNVTFTAVPNIDTSSDLNVKFWNGNVVIFGNNIHAQQAVPRGDAAGTALNGGFGETATRTGSYDGNMYNNIMGAPVALNETNGYTDFHVANAQPNTWVGLISNIGFEKKIADAGYYFDDDLLEYESCTVNGGVVVQNWSDTDAAANGYWVQLVVGTQLDDFNLNDTKQHTINWVVKFEDGTMVKFAEWTFKMAQVSGEMYEETDKPNANVIILAGQSNATGHAPLTQTIKDKVAGLDFSNIYMHYYTSQTMPADFTHVKQSNVGFDQYVPGMGAWVNPNAVDAEYFGPELGLAQYLVSTEALNGERWYIIKYSVCGSGLASDWLAGKNYAQDMLDFVDEAVTELSNTYDVKISGFMWMQGETDAMNEYAANQYAQNEQTLVSMVRNTFAKYSTRVGSEAGSGIAFIDMQIAHQAHGQHWTYADVVNQAKYNNCSNWVSGYYGQAGSIVPGAGWGANSNGKIANSIFVETAPFTYKWEATDEHAEYAIEGDKYDTDHYSATAMLSMGADKFGIAFEYMLSGGTVSTPSTPAPDDTPSYNVTYNLDDGSATTNVTAKQGETISLLAAPTREGYNFLGWSDGTTTYAAGAEYTVTGNVTLTAQWQRIQYTVTYNANGGSVNPDSNTVDAGGTVTLPTPTRNNYTFNGWYTAASGGTKVGNADASYTVNADITLYAQWTQECFTSDTLITLADGTQKRVDQLKATDKILAWDFFTGTYVEKEISLLVNHGDALYGVVNLKFSDDAMLKIIGEHGIFDYDLNKFVYITADNMHEYVGHRFVKYAADGSYDIVTLTKAYETEEYTSAWSISSAITSNAFASGLLTVAPPEDFYNWIEMGDKLMYDAEQFAKDVETYGLYTYDDFKDYVTYEQFVAWNGAYLKIAVEKGCFTFDYILELIELYKGWMP